MQKYLVTLAAVAPRHLSLAFVDTALHYLEDIGFPILNGPTWAKPRFVVHLDIAGAPRADHIATLRLMAEPERVDVFVLPHSGPGPRLLMADMDSTIIMGETLDDLATHAGVREQVAALTARAMDGSMDYRDALAARLDLIKGLDSTVLEKVRAAQKFSPGAAALVNALKKQGVVTVLVSGGFTVFTEHVATALGFDHHHGNILDLDAQGRITGQVVDPLIHHAKKRDILLDYCARLKIDPAQAIAVGDGANDIPMMQTAGYGIAYHPKPSVRSAIPNQILYTDLTAILYACRINSPE